MAPTVSGPKTPPLLRMASPLHARHSTCPRMRLRHQLLNHMGVVHIGQPFVAAVEVVGDSLVIQTYQMQDRGVEVGDHGAVFGGVVAELVGGAVGLAAADAAAGEPDAEALLVVVPPFPRLADRSAAEF